MALGVALGFVIGVILLAIAVAYLRRYLLNTVQCFVFVVSKSFICAIIHCRVELQNVNNSIAYNIR